MEAKTIVVAFDFDGTLVKKDTFICFIKYVYGVWSLVFGFLLFCPLIILMKLKIYPNWKCKQKLFSWYFKGTDYVKFAKLGQDFAIKNNSLFNNSIINKLQKHKNDGAKIYVISASIEEWVLPMCSKFNVSGVLCTMVEVDSNGKLTGKFLTKNCYGIEKVNRLLEREPNRNEYYLYAYGDSRGDFELLNFADQGMLIK